MQGHEKGHRAFLINGGGGGVNSSVVLTHDINYYALCTYHQKLIWARDMSPNGMMLRYCGDK